MYGQFCGVARALELVGERWGLLIVRDLILGPKRFTDLRSGLPRIPASILTARLNELEAAGVVRRRVLAQLDATVVYELTEYGSDLEPILLKLGLWGARSLGTPAPGEVHTRDTTILALYTMFRPQYAMGVHVGYELTLGDLVVHALVNDGVIKVSDGSYPDADLMMELFAPMTPLVSREVSPSQALDQGMLRVTGDPGYLDLFVDLFHIPAAPAPVEGLAVR
jgi:DNA-binding HxlR family transcriptional regulator